MKYLIAFALAFLCGLSVAQAAPPTATITFTAPTAYADGTPIASGTALTYNVYQGASGAAKTKVSTISSSPGTVNSGLVVGNNYCFQVTTVANGLESAMSNEGCKNFPFPKPGTVTITVTTADPAQMVESAFPTPL